MIQDRTLRLSIKKNGFVSDLQISPLVTLSNTLVAINYTIGRFRCTIRALGRAEEIYIDVASRSGVNLFGLNAIDSLNL